MNIEIMKGRFEKEQNKWKSYTYPRVAILPKAAFAPEGGFAPGIGCMDEGVVRMSIGDRQPPEIRLAGAGIMLGQLLTVSRDITVKLIKDHGLALISHHRDCGAGAAMASAGENGDAVVKGFATSVATEAGIKVVCAPLDRVPHHHKAAAHYYCSVPFAPTDDLPAGFVTSRFAVTREYGKRELRLAIDIAFGDHGFGELFTPERPYVIAVVASPGQQYLYKQEAEEVEASLPLQIRDRVPVCAYNTPQV